MRGQVSLEAVVVIVLLLVFLGFTITSTLQVQSFERFVSESSTDEAACLRVADIVQGVFLAGPGTRMSFEIDQPLQVTTSSVEVNQTYCYFSGVAVPVSLLRGGVLVSNALGVVSLVNG
jgi:hypothetical protein